MLLNVELYSKVLPAFFNLVGPNKMMLLYLISSYINWMQPYLHESRHRHALNRVRGSGGRFLSTKQLAQSNAEFVTGAHSGSDPTNIYQKEHPLEVESHSSKDGDNASFITTYSDRPCLSGNNLNFRQQECMFLGNSANMSGAPQCSGGLTFGGAKQRTSVVRWEKKLIETDFTGQANHPWLSHFCLCLNVFVLNDHFERLFSLH